MLARRDKRTGLTDSQAGLRGDAPLPPRDATKNAALAELQGELRRLRLNAGQPSFRAIAQGVGWSHSTVARAFTSENIPKWDLLEALADRLRDDTGRIRALWIASMQTDPAPEPPDNAPSPAVGRFPIATAVAAFCALLLVVMIRDLAPGRTQRNEFVTSAAQLVFVITSAVLWWRVVVTRDRGRENLAVALCLSGWALIAVRDVVAAGVGKTHLALPPPVDIAITYLSITCLIVFLTASLGRAQRKAAVIATVCLVLAGAGGFMLLHSRSADLSHGSKAGFALYSAMHLAGFALIARVALIKRNWTWALVLGGCAVLLAVDSSFAFLVSARPDGAVPVGASAGLLVCPLVLVVAARCAMAETCPDPAPELSQSVPTRAKNVPSSEN